jgi:tetratricopeptide (TPR) repeat protein
VPARRRPRAARRDETSLRLLQFLAGELAGARLLVVGTYRDVEVRRGHPLAAVLGALAREPACERIPLRGLDASEAARFVEDLLGEPPPEQLVAAVYEMTEGNPFFIQEIVRLLASDGGLDPARDARSQPLALPQSVRDAIGRRLDSLPDACDRLLRMASVLGREFSGSLLARVAELPDDQLLERIGEALAARVLVESEEGVGLYAFSHALIRQTLYDELDTPERVGLHRRAGEALEAACGAHLDPYLAELAHHFFQAAPGGDPEKAVDYGTRAAQRAQRLLAYEEAAWQYQRALRALELCVPRDEVRRCELQLALGWSHSTSGGRDRAQEVFQAAAEIARHLGRPDLLAHAALGRRSLADMGAPGDEAALSLIEEALEALGDTNTSLRARLLSRLVGTPPYADSMQRRDELSREALALARREAGPESLRDALIARRWACLGPDRIDERHALAREMFELAERLGDRSLAAFGHDVLLGAHLLRGETEAADRALAGFTRTAEELRQPIFVSQARVWQGSRALDRGEFEEAERLFREGFERGHGTAPYAHFILEGQMHILRAARGDPDHVERSSVFFGEMIEMPYPWEPAIRSSLAEALALRGETELARREFEQLAKRDFRELPRDEHWLSTMDSLSDAAAAVGDERRGALLYQLLEPYAELFLTHDILRTNDGSVAKVLGILATLLGRYREGAAHFERAIAKESAAGGRLAVLNTKASYARLLLLRGEPGDRERARELIAEAKTGWKALGARARRRLVKAFEPLGVDLDSPAPASKG